MARQLGLILVVTALAASACAAAGGVPETSDTPRRDLAERPTPISHAHVPATAGRRAASGARPSGRPTNNAGGASSPSASATSGGRTGAGVGSGGAPRASAAPFHAIAALTDGAGDAGLNTPPYSDLRSVTLLDNGSSLRVEVVLDGSLPPRTASDETLGIGVDLYRPGTRRESDYQLFADGEPDGWYAYLDTPRGFVRYPGTFGLGGNRIVFTVPWSTVGKLYTGRCSAFVDWSRRSTSVTGNKAGNDYAPTVGTVGYSR